MFPLIITYFFAFYSGRTSSISQVNHFLEISAIFPKISQKYPKFDFFACGWFFSKKVAYCAYFGGKTNFLSQLELIIKNPAIFSKKWLIFWVAQGLAGGTRRISDLDPLVMRFRQKNIMQTDLQG